MKRIGIMSDTHSYWDDRYVKYFSDCDEIWHAGDIGDYELMERIKTICPVVRFVCGNIDHGYVKRHCPELLIFEVEGVKVLITHVGGYPGKYPKGLKEILRKNDIKLFVSGHSHILKVMPDRELSLLHVNPGPAGVHGWQTVRTLVRLTLDNGSVSDLEVVELTKQPLN
ncbi:MAG: metallophosphatase family protein [Muribaculum sp.]|nr:metallophosphatase family protein [Muribaculaceae bacterium]MCM1081026.1 metallophosphatase family protein [Muribaculum sp.]